MQQQKVILNKINIDIKLQRMAFEVAESMNNNNELIVIGVKENGYKIAQKMVESLKKLLENKIILLSLSLNKQLPSKILLDQEINFTSKNILLVDDVCNSGKTLLYSLKPFLDFHPTKIEILVLVDRIYKQFPVKPNFVGLSIATTLQDFIEVTVEDDEIMEAVLISK
jgi:pyrimidine operon attenuation protein/uracil phosphoribosyltransferase